MERIENFKQMIRTKYPAEYSELMSIAENYPIREHTFLMRIYENYHNILLQFLNINEKELEALGIKFKTIIGIIDQQLANLYSDTKTLSKLLEIFLNRIRTTRIVELSNPDIVNALSNGAIILRIFEIEDKQIFFENLSNNFNNMLSTYSIKYNTNIRMILDARNRQLAEIQSSLQEQLKAVKDLASSEISNEAI